MTFHRGRLQCRRHLALVEPVAPDLRAVPKACWAAPSRASSQGQR